MAPASKNSILRKPNPGMGQGSMRAISFRTGWEYEHDETDEQIDAIEGLIAQVRAEPGKEKATFSWSSSTDDGEGDVRIGCTYLEDGLWVSEEWVIDPAGRVEAAE
jgi:hypothetical protein